MKKVIQKLGFAWRGPLRSFNWDEKLTYNGKISRQVKFIKDEITDEYVLCFVDNLIPLDLIAHIMIKSIKLKDGQEIIIQKDSDE